MQDHDPALNAAICFAALSARPRADLEREVRLESLPRRERATAV
jgi:hypothetical protein